MSLSSAFHLHVACGLASRRAKPAPWNGEAIACTDPDHRFADFIQMISGTMILSHEFVTFFGLGLIIHM